MPNAKPKSSRSAVRPLQPWWGEFTLNEGQGMAWAFGAREITLIRLANEWRIQEAPLEPVAEPEGDVQAKVMRRRRPAVSEGGLRRFVFATTTGKLAVAPLAADRPVVARPEHPVVIPPGEEVVLYVSSPLWLRNEVHQPPVQLAEIPIYRPSDIWFRPNTREGRLCYSSRTHARLHADNLPERAQRALTPVRVRNADQTPFALEKLNIPVPCLSLFADKRGKLWTEEVTLVREEEGRAVRIHIGKQPAGADTRVAEPRQAQSSTSLLAAIGEWLG